MTLRYCDLGVVKLFTHQKSNLVDAMEGSQHGMGFPSGSVAKNLPANAGDAREVVSIPGVRKIPWSRKWKPTPVFLPGKFHTQRSLMGYSLWSRKEPDTTQQLRMQACTYAMFKTGKFMQSSGCHGTSLVV